MWLKRKTIGRAINQRYWQSGAQDCTAHIISGGGGKNWHFTGHTFNLKVNSILWSGTMINLIYTVKYFLCLPAQYSKFREGYTVSSLSNFGANLEGYWVTPTGHDLCLVGARVVRLFDPQGFRGCSIHSHYPSFRAFVHGVQCRNKVSDAHNGNLLEVPMMPWRAW